MTASVFGFRHWAAPSPSLARARLSADATTAACFAAWAGATRAGRAVLAATSAAVLGSAVRRGDASLALPHALLLMATLAGVVGRQGS